MQNSTHRNRKVLLILDILMVLAILSNAGAYAMTNAMAVKKTPQVPIYEVNPAQVATTDLAAPPDNIKMLMYAVFFIHIVCLIEIPKASQLTEK